MTGTTALVRTKLSKHSNAKVWNTSLGIRVVPQCPSHALHDSHIKLIVVRHEQGATHMADGYAGHGKPGVVLVTSGPGATNTVTGLQRP